MLASFREMDRATRRMPRFDDLFRALDRALLDFGTGFEVLDVPAYPRLYVDETETEYVLTADLPGVNPEDAVVEVHDGVLSLRAERRLTVPEGFKPLRRERAGIQFSRSLRLPPQIDADRTSAEIKNGVLTVTLAKVAPPVARQIKVTAGV